MSDIHDHAFVIVLDAGPSAHVLVSPQIHCVAFKAGMPQHLAEAVAIETFRATHGLRSVTDIELLVVDTYGNRMEDQWDSDRTADLPDLATWAEKEDVARLFFPDFEVGSEGDEITTEMRGGGAPGMRH